MKVAMVSATLAAALIGCGGATPEAAAPADGGSQAGGEHQCGAHHGGEHKCGAHHGGEHKCGAHHGEAAPAETPAPATATPSATPAPATPGGPTAR